MSRNIHLSSEIKSTLKKLGLSSSFVTASSDTVEMLSILSGVDESSIVKVFESFLMYYIMNYIETPHVKCNIPFLGRIQTTVFERRGDVTQDSKGNIIEGKPQIKNEVGIQLLDKVSEDIKNIKQKKDVNLNIVNTLKDICVKEMQKSEDDT